MLFIQCVCSQSLTHNCRDSDLPLIVAIDLQPMAPIEGVIQVQGDITNARTAEVVHISFVPFSFHMHLFKSLNDNYI